MRVLLLGSNGYIGSEFLNQLLRKNHSVLCISSRNINKNIHPIDIIINCAGFTGKPNVDQGELKKAECIEGNILVPIKLEHLAKINKVPLVHISSGCIYTGNNNGKGFSEEDLPNFSFEHNNCSFYSGTKALVEKHLDLSSSYIFRLRIPFDSYASPRNYITKLLTYPKLVNVENSFSHREDFVRICIESIEKKIPYGIYNVTNTGSLTTENIVDMLVKHGFKKGSTFQFISEKEFYSSVAQSPRSNCVLDNSKILSTGINLRNIEDAFEEAITNYK